MLVFFLILAKNKNAKTVNIIEVKKLKLPAGQVVSAQKMQRPPDTPDHFNKLTVQPHHTALPPQQTSIHFTRRFCVFRHAPKHTPRTLQRGLKCLFLL